MASLIVRSAAVLVVTIAALAMASPAGACSLILQDPRDRIAGAEAAVYGVVTGAQLVTDGAEDDFDETYRYRLRVIKAFKGSVPSAIEVEGSTDEASCGAGRLRVGRRYGLLLDDPARQPLAIGLGSFIGLDELRAGTAPWPRASGRGRTAVLVGGSFGRATALAIGASGRIVAYGFGIGGRPLAVCPGGRRLITDRAVVRIRDLRPVRWRRAPRGDVVRCLDADGRRVVAFASSEEGPGTLRASVDGRVRVVARPKAYEAVLTPAFAVALGRDAVVRIDYRTGLRRVVAAVPRNAGGLAVSPGGRFVAAQFGANDVGFPTRIVTVDVATGLRSVARLRGREVVGDLLWLDDRRVTFLGGGVRGDTAVTFDAGLDRRLAGFPGWSSRSAALDGDAVWSIDFAGRLLHARLPEGPARVVRVLPHSQAYPVLVLPQRPLIGATRRRPR